MWPSSVLTSTPGMTRKSCFSAIAAASAGFHTLSCSVRQMPSSPNSLARTTKSSGSSTESCDRGQV